eukprot:444478-Pyramimonas_sp.AAC.1
MSPQCADPPVPLTGGTSDSGVRLKSSPGRRYAMNAISTATASSKRENHRSPPRIPMRPRKGSGARLCTGRSFFQPSTALQDRGNWRCALSSGHRCWRAARNFEPSFAEWPC